MPLFVLPNELLFLIASFTPSPRDIRSLTLTSRRLSHLLSAHLTSLSLTPLHSPCALLHAAARTDHAATRHLLLHAPFTIDVSPRLWCCIIRNGHERTYPRSGTTPSDDPLLLEFVLEVGPHLVLVEDDALGIKAIMWAVRNRALGLLARILSAKDPVDVYSLCSAQREACRRGYADVLGMLLPVLRGEVEKQHPGSRSYDEGADLVEAAAEGHVDVVRLLIEEKEGREGIEKIAAAAVEGAVRRGHREVVGVLLRCVDEGSFTDWKHRSALFLAAELDDAELVRWFLKRGVKVGKKDSHKRTALHVAAKAGAVEAMRALVEGGADIEACDLMQRRPIHAAARFERWAAMRVLVEMGADVTVANGNGTTPLHLAARRGGEEDVQMLVERGASLDVVDNCGKAPRYWVDLKKAAMAEEEKQ